MIFKKVTRAVALALLAFWCPAATFAGRPLVVDDAEPVPRGHVEMELGFAYGQPHRGGREQKLPATLAYGLLPTMEVGLGIQRLHSDAKGAAPADGFEDLHVNAKYKFLEEAGALPRLALAFDVKAPTANRRKGLSSGKWDQGLLLLASKALAALEADGNLGYLLVGSPAGEKLKNRIHGGMAGRWSVARQWTLVAEISGLSRAARGAHHEANLQGGIRYQIDPALTLDAAAGRSLRSAGARIQATFGLTWTFALFR